MTLQEGGGRLGRLLEEVLRVVGGGISHRVDLVSLFDCTSLHQHLHLSPLRLGVHPLHRGTSTHAIPVPSEGVEREGMGGRKLWPPPPPPCTCVWLSVRGPEGVFLNPTRFQGLLGLHLERVRSGMRLIILVWLTEWLIFYLQIIHIDFLNRKNRKIVVVQLYMPVFQHEE